MIIGWAKLLGVTPAYVLHEITYQNLIMYSLAAPHYDDIEDEWDESLDANNPDNFNTNEEEEFIR